MTWAEIPHNALINNMVIAIHFSHKDLWLQIPERGAYADSRSQLHRSCFYLGEIPWNHELSGNSCGKIFRYSNLLV